MGWIARPNLIVAAKPPLRPLEFTRHAFQQRHETHLAKNLGREPSHSIAGVAAKLLDRTLADRRHQDAGGLELLKQDLGLTRRRRGDQNAVKRRLFGPAKE